MTTETEKAKMLRGELYFSMDADLFKERQETRKLVKRYNELDGAETPEAKEILTKMLGAKGRECFIEMPFRCDYGSNIRLGDNVYMNFNCVLLDVCEITIGDRVMLAPNVQLYTATHPLGPKARASGYELGKPITIEDDVWIGVGIRQDSQCRSSRAHPLRLPQRGNSTKQIVLWLPRRGDARKQILYPCCSAETHSAMKTRDEE